jgi:hypothetical protein
MTTGVTRLADVIVPETFFDYMSLDTTKQSKLFNSGLIQHDAQIASRLGTGGVAWQTPFWGDLEDDGSNIGSDDPARIMPVSKIGSSKHQFVRHFRTKGWSAAKLTKELAGSDPMQRISARSGAWWAREMDKFGFSTIKGVLAGNIAANSGDMVHDVTAATGSWTINGESVSKKAMSARTVLDAKNQLGDIADLLKKIAMHSNVYTELQKQQLITFKEHATANIRIPYYLDYQVLVDDNMPTSVAGPDVTYTSFLYADGIFGYGENPPDKPVFVKEEDMQGNGVGVEILGTRRQFALTPYWWSFTNNTVSDEFPTNADLELAANWDRKATERKHIPLVFIKTLNG